MTPFMFLSFVLEHVLSSLKSEAGKPITLILRGTFIDIFLVFSRIVTRIKNVSLVFCSIKCQAFCLVFMIVVYLFIVYIFLSVT